MAFDVFADDDTQPNGCALCAARSAVDAALVRLGVSRITVVTELTRPSHGPPIERSRAFLALPVGNVAFGDGESREEAILQALHSAGVTL